MNARSAIHIGDAYVSGRHDYVSRVSRPRVPAGRGRTARARRVSATAVPRASRPSAGRDTGARRSPGWTGDRQPGGGRRPRDRYSGGLQRGGQARLLRPGDPTTEPAQEVPAGGGNPIVPALVEEAHGVGQPRAGIAPAIGDRRLGRQPAGEVSEPGHALGPQEVVGRRELCRGAVGLARPPDAHGFGHVQDRLVHRDRRCLQIGGRGDHLGSRTFQHPKQGPEDGEYPRHSGHLASPRHGHVELLHRPLAVFGQQRIGGSGVAPGQGERLRVIAGHP